MYRTVRTSLAVSLVALLPLGSCAQEADPGETPARVPEPLPTPNQAREVQPEIPPSPEIYLGRRIAQTMHYSGAPWLVRESRTREEGTRLLLENLGVVEGSTVCDVGCGNGFYTLPLAEMVGPEGRVIGVDIQPEMLEMLEARAAEAGAANVETVQGSIIDPRLEPGSIDLALLIDVYHEFSHPVQMLARLRESLAPDGRMVVLEFRAEDPEVPIKELHKMSKAQVLKEMSANGFRLEKEFDGLPWQHMMTFVADPGWRGPDAD